MADIYRNQFARGFRGTFSRELVVHQTGSGKTIVASKPLFNETLIDTEKLTMHQAAVRDAAIYASFAEHEDAYIRLAQALGSTAYALAVADWYATPRVLAIDVDRWTGYAGETIRVKARDNVMVASVRLIVRDTEGHMLEMGDAAPSQAGSPWWNYTTRSTVALTPFPSVQAIAFDLPGNRDSFIIH